MRSFLVYGVVVWACLNGCEPNKGHRRPENWAPPEEEKHIPERCVYRYFRRMKDEQTAEFYFWVGSMFELAMLDMPIDTRELIFEEYLFNFFKKLFYRDPTCATVFKGKPHFEVVDAPSESTESMKQMINSCFHDRGSSCVDSYTMDMHEPDEMQFDTKFFYNIRTANVFLSTRPSLVKLLRIEVVSPGSGSAEAFICSLFDDQNPLSNDAWETNSAGTGFTLEGDEGAMYGLQLDWKPDVHKFLNFCVDHIFKAVAVRIVEAVGVKDELVMNGDPRETRFTIGKAYTFYVPHNAHRP